MGRLLYWVLMVGTFNLAYEYSQNKKTLGGIQYKYASYLSLKERIINPLIHLDFNNINWKIFVMNVEKDYNDIIRRNQARSATRYD